MKRILEICCGDPESVRAAVAGGAQRIELCAALESGGVTPTVGAIRHAAKSGIPKLHVLVRPRPGDFCYSEEEVDVMCADIIAARESGADGIAIGALTPTGEIDVEACRKFADAASGMSLTFHRAFDLCRDPFLALETLVELGFDRILTSGQAPSAMMGKEMLRRLKDAAGGRIIILGAAGVNSGNARELVESTGLIEIHASARKGYPSPMHFRREGVSMGAPGSDEYSVMRTSPEEVAAIISKI